MFGLAVRSVRRRATAFVATFLAVFLGAVLVMAFGALADTGAATGVSDLDQETLTTMAVVVGGWGLLLVAFAVTSTLTLSVHQRAMEMALLKSAGATPAQLRQMILGEAGLLAVVGALVAVPFGALSGRGLLALLKRTDQVSEEVAYAFGPVALGTGLGVTILAALGAAVVTSRRVAAMRVTAALSSAAAAEPRPKRMGKARVIAGVVFFGISLQLSVMAALAGPEGFDAMQFAGSADIMFGLGLACFAPVLMRWTTTLLAGPILRFSGASGYLAVLNLRQRTAQLASALTPVILFVGIGVGTLWMQVIHNDTTPLSGVSASEEAVETLNFVITGMIVLFACIMLINTLVAATTHRRREFGQQRLVGATHRQVLGMVAAENLVLIVAGLGFGTIAALPTVLPMSYAKTDSWLPDPEPGLWLGTAAVAVVVTLAASLGTARRVLRTPAIETVARAG